MSKLVKMRDNTTLYVTDEQAEGIFDALNDNPNLRIIRIITGQGYFYINPLSIVSMVPSSGDGYRRDDEIIAEQKRFLGSSPKREDTERLRGNMSKGLIN